MNIVSKEQQAIRCKALVVVNKIIGNLEQLDRRDFPTEATESARKLLLDILCEIKKPENRDPMEPSVLYNKVLMLQELVGYIERSSTEHIPWPFVGYCDKLWERLFSENNPKIFYSVAQRHEYKIRLFSLHLKKLLQDILPTDVINRLIADCDIYCLELASVEDENLPLYANIGHEFGHAIYNGHIVEISTILDGNNKHVIRALHNTIYADDPIQADSYTQHAVSIVSTLAKELFCDLVAATLMGPAFFLSFYEMSWGQTRNAIEVFVLPRLSDIQAHPSFNFRLSLIEKCANVGIFVNEVRKELAALNASSLKNAMDLFETVPTVHGSDDVKISLGRDLNSALLLNAIKKNLDMIKKLFEDFLTDANAALSEWYPHLNTNLPASDVVALLARLEHNILPNIIPDNSLLGKPVDFKSILNASALYRMYMLENERLSFNDRIEKMEMLERLTGKALEVSFIQQEFLEWKETH